MGIFGNIGKAIKKGVVDVGHFTGKALSNPIVEGALALTPLGIPAAAIAGVAGGALKPGGGLKGAVTGGLKGTAAGAVGSAIGKIPGVKGAVGSVLGGVNNAATHIPGVANVEDFLKEHIGDLSHIPGLGNIGDIAGKLGGAVGLGTGGQSFDPTKLAMMGLAAAQIKNNADLQGKSEAYGKQALGAVQDSYNARAGLRSAGIAGMLNPQIQDISSIRNTANPYAKGLLPNLGKPPTVGMGVAPVSSFS